MTGLCRRPQPVEVQALCVFLIDPGRGVVKLGASSAQKRILVGTPHAPPITVRRCLGCSSNL